MENGTRAIDELMGNALQAIVKQLLRPFKPGEDRFAGMDVQARPSASLQPGPDPCELLHDLRDQQIRFYPPPVQDKHTSMGMCNTVRAQGGPVHDLTAFHQLPASCDMRSHTIAPAYS